MSFEYSPRPAPNHPKARPCGIVAAPGAAGSLRRRRGLAPIVLAAAALVTVAGAHAGTSVGTDASALCRPADDIAGPPSPPAGAAPAPPVDPMRLNALLGAPVWDLPTLLPSEAWQHCPIEAAPPAVPTDGAPSIICRVATDIGYLRAEAIATGGDRRRLSIDADFGATTASVTAWAMIAPGPDETTHRLAYEVTSSAEGNGAAARFRPGTLVSNSTPWSDQARLEALSQAAESWQTITGGTARYVMVAESKLGDLASLELEGREIVIIPDDAARLGALPAPILAQSLAIEALSFVLSFDPCG